MPSPGQNESSKDKWMDRCIPDVMDKGETDDPDQAAAICAGIWDDAKNNEAKMNHREIKFHQDPGAIRTEKAHGKEHIVVPAIALVEGVLNAANSPSPELTLAEEFGKFPAAWNGRPVMMNHPSRDGNFVSAASSPDVLEESVGTVFNASLDEDKLKVEFFLDPDKMPQEEVDRIQSGGTVEVSTGFFTEVVPVRGTFNNEHFEGVQTNITPDHIALLEEGTIGACSVEDGCGAPRVNHLKTDENGKTTLVENARRIDFENLFQLAEDGQVLDLGEDVKAADLSNTQEVYILISFKSDRVYEGETFNSQEMAEDRANTLADQNNDWVQVAVSMGTREDDTVVYRRIAEYMGEESFNQEGNRKMAKKTACACGGTCGPDCACKTSSENDSTPQERKFLDKDSAIEQNNSKDTEKGNIISALADKIANKLFNREDIHMAADKNEKTKEDLIGEVIANEANPFDENDKEVLVNFSEEKLKAFAEAEVKEEETVSEGDTKQKAEEKGAEPTDNSKAEEGQKTEQDPKAFTQTSAYDQLPEGVRAFLDRKLAEEDAEKEELATKLAENEGIPYKKELLKEKPIDELKGLAAWVDNLKGEEDYSGLGGPRANAVTGESESVPEPPQVFSRPKNKQAA